LTNEYFKYYKGFFSKTFLYYEEDIIYILSRKLNKNTKYISNTYIIHKEDKSTELVFGENKNMINEYAFQSYKWVILLYLLPNKTIKIIFDV